MSGVKERLLQFIRLKELTTAEFERNIKVSSGYVKNISKSIQPEILENISLSYPDLNIEWLLINKGRMTNSTQTSLPFPEKANYVDVDINERINKIVKELFDNRLNKMAQRTFIRQRKLEAMLRGDENPDYSDFCNIAQHTNVNLKWLITGEGSMLKEKAPSIANTDIFHGEKLIPLYRNEAAAGFGTADFAIKDTDIEGYYKIKEFMNADFMLHVRGDSMLPLYKPGDTIAVREIKECKFIQWGKPHLISARYQGLLIKRLYAGDREDEVKAVSENREVYPPFKIPLEEITGIALVIGTVRLDNF